MNRTRYDRRVLRRRKVKSRCALLMRIGGSDLLEGWTRGAPGRLAKGKMHCSCSMCRLKSREIPGRREMRQMDACRQALSDVA